MNQIRLTPRDRNLLALGTKLRTGVLTEGQVYERLAADYQMGLTAWWVYLARQTSNPAARAEFPELIAWLEQRQTDTVAYKKRLRGAA